MTEPLLLRVPTGSRIPDLLCDLATEHQWRSALCTGIGGVSHVELAYYDLEAKEYLTFRVEGISELVSLSGNLTTRDGLPFWHLHAVVANRTGQTRGGHLMSCVVALTVELSVWPLQRTRTRSLDVTSGLRLLDD